MLKKALHTKILIIIHEDNLENLKGKTQKQKGLRNSVTLKMTYLQKGLGTRSSGLEHDRQDGKKYDLNRGSACIPIGSANTILEKKRIKIFIASLGQAFGLFPG